MTESARYKSLLLLLFAALFLAGCSTAPVTATHKRTGFIGLKDFSKFTRTTGQGAGEVVMTSPEIAAPLDWNELVVSWNVRTNQYLKVEARGIYTDHATKYYTMGLWSSDPAAHPRESVKKQGDSDGTVNVDTMVLSKPCGKVQIRVTIGGGGEASPEPKFIGLSFCNSAVPPPAGGTNRAAWGKTIEVPERRQGEYAGGGGWCSPTSLSMMMAYWSDRLNRPEMNRTVPDTAAAINDRVWNGTGNWPFNTAFAGSYDGMRSYVTRFNDLSECEDWVAAGIPVVISVSSYLTNDRHIGPDNGHLIVCLGFTADGEVITNDPGVSVRRNVRARRTYPRDRVIHAWQKSKNAVYLIYPENAPIPANRAGDWESK